MGIQYYLCGRLSEFPLEQIEFLLPQLCHLLVFQAKHTHPLQTFVLDCCGASAHFALLLRWYLDAYLADLDHHLPTDTDAWRQCTHLSDRLDALFDTDARAHIPPETTWAGSSGRLRHLFPHVGPMLLGMGSAMAAFGSPELAHYGLHMALQLSQMEYQDHHPHQAGTSRRTSAKLKASSTSSLLATLASRANASYTQVSASADNLAVAKRKRMSNSRSRSSVQAKRHSFITSHDERASSSLSLQELHQGDAFSFDRFVEKLGTGNRSKRTSNATANNMNDIVDIAGLAEANMASPIMHSPTTAIDSILNPPQHLQDTIYYLHAQQNFIQALTQISDRLLTIPKQARLDSLRAELALLNHNLPARVCLPMWCPASAHRSEQLDSSTGSLHAHSVPHHLIVRIASNEGVVLNSADRVPYLILVEVIEYDAAQGSGGMEHDFVAQAGIQLGDGFVSQALSNPTMANGHAEPWHAGVLGGNSKHLTREVGDLAKLAVDMQTLSRANSSPELKSPIELMSDVRLNSNPSSATSSPSATADSSHPYPNPALSPTAIQAASEKSDYDSKMRTAAIMLAQLTHQSNTRGTIRPADQKLIQERILKEMKAMEEARFQKVMAHPSSQFREMRDDRGGGGGVNGTVMDEEWVDEMGEGTASILDDRMLSTIKLMKDDPSASVFNEDWNAKIDRIKASSPYGTLPGWRCLSCIVKTGADLRQEQLALQLIKEMKAIWAQENVPVWVHYYRILVTSDSTGLIETIANSISIHSLKKNAYANNLNHPGRPYTLFDHFVNTFGGISSPDFIKARDAFMRSLAGYSLVTYILNLKDRHNGNILLDREGHLIHIDFGFMLGNSPGNVGFESAPFKFPQEYMDVLGGKSSATFSEFKSLLLRGFLALRKHADKLILLIELMRYQSHFPCFGGTPVQSDVVMNQLRERFLTGMTDKNVEEAVERWVLASHHNVFMRLYDNFQYYSNGIL